MQNQPLGITSDIKYVPYYMYIYAMSTGKYDQQWVNCEFFTVEQVACVNGCLTFGVGRPAAPHLPRPVVLSPQTAHTAQGYGTK